jgi:hypothetical protein
MINSSKEAMPSWRTQLGALTSLFLLTVRPLSSLAASPAVTGPSPELLAATRVLDRLMAAASSAAPITLIVRPFRGVVCPTPAADPVARSEATAAAATTPTSSLCLRGFELPPLFQQGFFVPFVVVLQRQADPESDPERPSAAIEERTILLNASGLELVRQVSPPGKRQPEQPAAFLTPAATCRIAQEFAAVQLGQPQQRRERFERIHALLAERIHKAVSLTRPTTAETVVGYLLMPFLPFLMIQYPQSTVEMIHSRNMSRWINARLVESPHWRVLLRDAPTVAASLKELGGLPWSMDSVPVTGSYIHSPSTISDVWVLIDAWFGVAAQERDEVIEEQQKQAQVEALRLLAAAGFDPRACTDVFLSASAASPDAAVLEVYEQARRKGLDQRSGLPSHFLPADQKVVIYPRGTRPGNGSSGADSGAGPEVPTR